MVVQQDLARHWWCDVDEEVSTRRRYQGKGRPAGEVGPQGRVRDRIRANHEVGVGPSTPLQAHVAEGNSHTDPPEHQEVHGGRTGLPLEILRLAAVVHILVVPALLRTEVQDGGEEHRQGHHDQGATCEQHRLRLAFRAPPRGVRQMAGLGHDTAVQGLDLDGVGAIVDLHLGPSVAGKAPHACSRSSISLGRRGLRRGRSILRRRCVGSGGRGCRPNRRCILQRRWGGLRRGRSGHDWRWRGRFGTFGQERDGHANVAELDLIPALEAGLGDALTVEQRAPG